MHPFIWSYGSVDSVKSVSEDDTNRQTDRSAQILFYILGHSERVSANFRQNTCIFPSRCQSLSLLWQHFFFITSCICNEKVKKKNYVFKSHLNEIATVRYSTLETRDKTDELPNSSEKEPGQLRRRNFVLMDEVTNSRLVFIVLSFRLPNSKTLRAGIHDHKTKKLLPACQ